MFHWSLSIALILGASIYMHTWVHGPRYGALVLGNE
jgi:hypothetical protein